MGKGPHRAFREVAMKDRLTLYLRGVSAGAIATIFLATPVVAQDVTGGAPAAARDESEAIVVTGTRIRRPNLDSNSPMTVVSDEESRYQGATTVESVLNRLPQFTADPHENVPNGPDGPSKARQSVRRGKKGRV